MLDRRVFLTGVFAGGFLSIAAPLSAKEKIKNKGNGNKGKGHGANKVPPGQIKRYTRGAKLPGDLRYTDIGDLSKWKLKPPGNGNRYIRVDNEILEVSDDLSTVVDAVGIVDDLLK